MKKAEVGKLGEDLAYSYLKKSRYKIVERNYREKWGELDIISISPDGTLVFVEVKTVTNSASLISPEEQVTKKKLKRLRQTSYVYANNNPELIKSSGWQIDLVAITIKKEKAEIKHYKNI